jgi:rhodanese-related sulfurtransferase
MNDAIANITARQLQDRFSQADDLTLLDVREPWERHLASIAAPEGVRDVHIPINSVPSRLIDIRDSSASRLLVVYCHHGVRSRMVAEWLAGQGVGDAANLEGGIEAWSIEVDPSVRRY